MPSIHRSISCPLCKHIVITVNTTKFIIIIFLWLMLSTRFSRLFLHPVHKLRKLWKTLNLVTYVDGMYGTAEIQLCISVK